MFMVEVVGFAAQCCCSAHNTKVITTWSYYSTVNNDDAVTGGLICMGSVFAWVRVYVTNKIRDTT